MNTILVPFHLDERVDGLPFPDALVIEPGSLPDAPPWERLAALYDPVAGEVAAADRPLVVSADCTTSLGTLAGLQRKGCDPAIAWFDAHGDFNTHETTVTGYLGGMPLALAVGRGDPTLRERLGLRPVPEARVILGDARDLDPPERIALDASAVRRVKVAEMVPPDGDIYVHLDLDVLHPDELDGLILPVAGGPSLATLISALRRLADTGRVVAVGVACTFHPHRTRQDQLAGVIDAVLEALD